MTTNEIILITFVFQDVIEALAKIGHNYTIAAAADGFAAVTAISNITQIEAKADSRRPGAIAYIY